MTNVTWLERAKKKFKVGDRVAATVRFAEKDLQGTVTETYDKFILINFDIGFRQCFGYFAIYRGIVKAC